MGRRILVVDDDEAIREVLRLRLQAWGYQVELAADSRQVVERVHHFRPHLVLTDVVMPHISGMDLLELLKEGDSERPVILMTAHATFDMAVEAIKEGAQDFLTKPLDYDKLKSVLDAVEEELQLLASTRRVASRLNKGSGFGPFVGASRPMKKVYHLVADLADTGAAVLVTGESGTGKELVARSLHDLSSRSGQPFIAVNAAAIPQELMESEIFGHEKGAFTGASSTRPGCFEMAHRGTLFLDEISEMPVLLQPKLLRVLEDGIVRRLGSKRELRVDVRLVSATNRPPVQAIREKKLRQDLFYRLNVFQIDLPPLRERPSDLPLLVQHFIAKFNEKHSFDVVGCRPEVLAELRGYEWPGNIRELRNLIERSVVLAKRGWIETSHLPAYLTAESVPEELRIPVGATAAEVEKELILATLRRVGNNKAEAARQLDLDVKTIRNKLSKYGHSS